MIRLPSIAIASAVGWLRSIVCMFPFTMIRSAANDGLFACVAKLIDMSRYEAINKQSDFIIDLAKVILIADDALQYRER